MAEGGDKRRGEKKIKKDGDIYLINLLFYKKLLFQKM